MPTAEWLRTSFMIATLLAVTGYDAESEEHSECKLVFASPRQGARIRFDVVSFPIAVLLEGRGCDPKGNVTISIDQGQEETIIQYDGRIARGELMKLFAAKGGFRSGHGIKDRHHILSARIASGIAEIYVEFVVGPPRPGVEITTPQPRSITADDTIGIYVTLSDFDIPKDGVAVLSLDNSEISTMSLQSPYFEIPDVPAGEHIVRVSLQPSSPGMVPEAGAVHDEVTFTVVRPRVEIRAAHTSTDDQIVVKLTALGFESGIMHIIHVSAKGDAGGSLTDSWEIWRADHYIFRGKFPRGGGQVQVKLMREVLGEDKAGDFTACADGHGPASNEEGGRMCGTRETISFRVVASDVGGVEDVPTEEAYQEDCSHTFISVGAHDGSDMREFLSLDYARQGSPVWEGAAPFAWFKNLSLVLPLHVRPRDFCLVALEANPHLTQALTAASTELRNGCREIALYTGTAAWVETGNVELRLDNFARTRGLSASLMPGHPHAGGGGEGGVVTVPAVRLRNVAEDARARTARLVIMKMDIEGAEYEILRSMLADGSLCATVDILLVEWHLMAVSAGADAPPEGFEEALEWALGAKGCRTVMYGSLW